MDIGTAAASGAIDMVGNAMGAEMGMRMQEKQNQKLIDQQLKANKNMAAYSMDLSKQYWKDTNYQAQGLEMDKAGLNRGLMYKGSGEGGQTISPTTGNQGGGAQAPNLGMAMNLALTAAQIDNIEADTAKKEAEVTNTDANTELTKVNTTLQNMWKMEADDTRMGRYEQIENNAWKAFEEARTLLQQYNVGAETYRDTINKIKAESIGATLQNLALEAGIKKTEEECKRMGAEMVKWAQEMENQGKQLDLQETKMWIDGIIGGVNAVGNIVGMKQVRDILLKKEQNKSAKTTK